MPVWAGAGRSTFSGRGGLKRPSGQRALTASTARPDPYAAFRAAARFLRRRGRSPEEPSQTHPMSLLYEVLTALDGIDIDEDVVDSGVVAEVFGEPTGIVGRLVSAVADEESAHPTPPPPVAPPYNQNIRRLIR
jgi:hypothetical protein